MTKITPQQGGKDDLPIEVVGAPVLRRALESYLQALPGIATLQEKNKVRQIVLIVGAEGQEYIRNRQAQRPSRRKNVRYVLLTRGMDIDYTLARDLPISGFIADDDPPETFLEGLKAVGAGTPFCSARLISALVAAATPPAEAPHPYEITFSAGNHEETLSPTVVPASARVSSDLPAEKGDKRQKHPLGLSAREAEIVSHAAHGLSNTEIADTLYLSLPTIKFHLYRAYQKIGVRRRSQLAGILAGVG